MLTIFYSAFLGAVVSSLIFALEGFSNLQFLDFFFLCKTSFMLSCKIQKDLDICEIHFFLILEVQNFHQDVFN